MKTVTLATNLRQESPMGYLIIDGNDDIKVFANLAEAVDAAWEDERLIYPLFAGKGVAIDDVPAEWR